MVKKMPIKCRAKSCQEQDRKKSNSYPKRGGHTAAPKLNACEQLLRNNPVYFRRCPLEGKEVIRVHEKNGYRKLIVPSKEPTVYPKIISEKEFSDLLERSRTQTKAEKELELAAAEREKERIMRESMARKEAIHMMDMQRNLHKRDDRMNDIEEEARQRTMHLLERAAQLKLEQEDEIKKCNKIILETKCRAIRDAQLAEKRLLDREHAQEEHRLNNLMEQERLAAIEIEKQKDMKRSIEMQKFSQVLKEQIQANEDERQLEYLRKREECRLINLNLIAQQEAEIEKIQKKEEEKLKARQEFIDGNERLRHFKAMEEAEARIMDQRIQEFQREKAARDARLIEEQRREQLQKEREKDRIAKQAIQANLVSNQIEELHTARIQEEVEREWRRKEKEEAIKRAETLKALRESRDNQIKKKIQQQALEVQREKMEFDKILALQKEAICREELERDKKHRQALKHRSEILKQVNEKEKAKILSRQKLFEEGLAIRAETEQRNRKLRDAMERKCREMQESQVPDLYIKEVKKIIEQIK